MKRLASIDALRGLVMIIMALDHVREFYHVGAMSFQPDDLSETTAALFFTRWITHFCAPVFMFTAGVGAFFWLRRPGRTPRDLSRFLWTRGAWLILLELTLMRVIMLGNPAGQPIFLVILWSLGLAMILTGFLIRLPLRLAAAISIAFVALHNLLDPIPAAKFGKLSWLWSILHQPGFFMLGDTAVIPGYPVIPWFAVMTLGFCFGRVLLLEPVDRRRWTLRLGIAATMLFLVLRTINVYGDPFRWSTQFPGKTALAFLRVTKYPPSLDFLLMTLGPALILLAIFDRLTFARANPLIVFGRVPLFYFLGHFALAHLLLIPMCLAKYGSARFLIHPVPSMGGDAKSFPPGFGWDLGTTYLVWIAVVAMMYPLCLWFSRLKERRTDWWLSYL